MKNYESPKMLRSEELAEGVYLASGEAVVGGVCDSQNRQGQFDAELCKTCRCYNNSHNQPHCTRDTKEYKEGQNMPTWEKQGQEPPSGGNQGNNGHGNKK